MLVSFVWRNGIIHEMEDTYCVAKAGILHFNQDFIWPDFIEKYILKDKRGSWFLNHECSGWDLFFWDHDIYIRDFLMKWEICICFIKDKSTSFRVEDALKKLHTPADLPLPHKTSASSFGISQGALFLNGHESTSIFSLILLDYYLIDSSRETQ